ncbi:MAG: macro domain-containing protein [Rhodobacteraceae bacterium]|nr:macro domain-containing protein [Paracoccaceae bacterium]
MINYTDGDLFESPAKVLVNTVNTCGVMGKGIALRFKKIYPDMFARYREHCENGSLSIGKLLLHKTPHKWILNFPTKEHWRNPSRVEYIEAGLKKFNEKFAIIGATSVAFPMLGCGNGELDFESEVKPLMERYLRALPIPMLIHVGHNHIGPPEHHDQKRIENWLRSEPTALPFEEVWRDIMARLQSPRELMTMSRGNRFKAVAQHNPPALQITSSGGSFWIREEELVNFWQQLRDYGLTHNRIAPNHRYLSYLMPVFEELEYVRSVSVSASATRLRTNPESALQIIPPSLGNRQQLDLFSGVE